MNTVPETSIFTKIINREIPADIVYEDDIVIAFLTIEPVSPGHTLVVPKTPFKNVFDGDERTMGHMMMIAQKIAHALVDSNLGGGVNLIMNNGIEAGQEVFHAHLHVIPRNNADIAIQIPHNNSYPEGKSAEIAKQISQNLK
jgi:histidine triad (HIT) family protein